MYFRCDNILKVWPRVGPHVFKCQIGQECDPERLEKLAKNENEVNGEKGGFQSSHSHNETQNRQYISCANNGESRYCCFQDGFDVCNLCAEEVLSTKAPLTASTMGNNTATSTSNGSSASKQLNGGWFDVQLKTISQTVQEETEKNGIIRNGKVIVVQNEV